MKPAYAIVALSLAVIVVMFLIFWPPLGQQSIGGPVLCETQMPSVTVLTPCP